MLDALFALIPVKRGHICFQQRHSVRKQTIRDRFRRHRRRGRPVNLGPIAGRQQERFGTTGHFPQSTIDRGMSDKTFARLHVRGVMAEADAKKVHGS